MPAGRGPRWRSSNRRFARNVVRMVHREKGVRSQVSLPVRKGGGEEAGGWGGAGGGGGGGGVGGGGGGGMRVGAGSQTRGGAQAELPEPVQPGDHDPVHAERRSVC